MKTHYDKSHLPTSNFLAWRGAPILDYLVCRRRHIIAGQRGAGEQQRCEHSFTIPVASQN
ncbi:MAG: hypothetical protein PHS96_06285 [Anaerolineales bacterium]|nr:hypothetical protein [Anaerolineales bacterium]